jgi:hypothetical protein
MQKALLVLAVLFSATLGAPTFAEYYRDFESWCKNTMGCIGIEASANERERQYQRWLDTLPPEERRHQEELQLLRQQNHLLYQLRQRLDQQ